PIAATISTRSPGASSSVDPKPGSTHVIGIASAGGGSAASPPAPSAGGVPASRGPASLPIGIGGGGAPHPAARRDSEKATEASEGRRIASEDSAGRSGPIASGSARRTGEDEARRR